MSARPSAIVARAAVAFVVLATAACAADDPESDGESAAQASTQAAPKTVAAMTTCPGYLGTEVSFGGPLRASGAQPACRHVATVDGKVHCVTSTSGCVLERGKLEVSDGQTGMYDSPTIEATCSFQIWTGRATEACECTLGDWDTGYNPRCKRAAAKLAR